VLPDGFIQELLARVDIVEVVGRHVELKRSGANHMGLCPFHGEKTPSFTVSAAKQFYHCFGCGAHGDAIRFLMENQGLPFMDAVHELAQRAGVSVPEGDASPEERARAAEKREKRQTLTDVLARAGEHYRAALKITPRAIDYLKRRGLTGEIAARFALGYAPAGWRSLASAFARYDDPLLVEAGLVIVQGDDDEQKRYDRFRDRIMFPIRSVRGEVIGFGGRVIDDGEPKYLNSPETPLFVKGRELYGLYEARAALREAGYALVVEGYMDVVALAQSGFAHAVATLGTACTADHVAKLFRFTDHVVFSFDGDAAGRRAAGRALEAALTHAGDQRSVRFLFLPPEHDPDSYVREFGGAAFEQQVRQAVPLSRQLLDHAAQECDLGSAEGRSRMLSQAKPLVDLLPQGMLREQLIPELARLGGVAPETLTAHWSRAAAKARATAPVVATPRPRAMRATPKTATQLDRAAWLALRHGDLWLRLGSADHDLLSGQPEPYGPLFAAIDKVLHDHGPLTMDAAIAEVGVLEDDAAMASLLQRLRGFHDVAADTATAAKDEFDAVLRFLWTEAVKDELNQLAAAGELSPESAERQRVLYEQLRQLKATAASPSPAQTL
jgi:DNA primase